MSSWVSPAEGGEKRKFFDISEVTAEEEEEDVR